MRQRFYHRVLRVFFIGGVVCLLAATLMTATVLAQDSETSLCVAAPFVPCEPPLKPVGSPLHPVFALLDAAGKNVFDANEPVSTLQTCGTCHDTAFIAQHSLHADVGWTAGRAPASERTWETGMGWYGAWSPITYAAGNAMTAAEWVQSQGWRHVGGGVAAEIGIEMNCFLCHLDAPNNAARVAALENGQFKWANTATLVGTGIVEPDDDSWRYNPAVLDANKALLPQYVTIAEPRDANCGFCHGVADDETQTPLNFDVFDTTQWHTLIAGQVFSPQRISSSGLNLQDKPTLTRSWDIHAERVVGCTECHYALNNPVFYVEPDASRPEHLEFDPRRMDFGDYLERPLHQFANGGQAYSSTFPVFERADRDCATCHDAVSTHTWLEYSLRHMQALTCEVCHIPKLYAPALETIDWTVLSAADEPRMTYRGVDGASQPPLITGYEPVLLLDADQKPAPYNLLSVWYWVAGEPAEPIAREALHAAYFDDNAYAAEVLAAFDADGDSQLSEVELVINTDAKEALITARLEAQGLLNPRIMGEVTTYAVHHNVTQGEWATRECSTCHTENSRLSQPLLLAKQSPGGVTPLLISDNLQGNLETDEQGALLFVPNLQVAPVDLYILGHDSATWIDSLGMGLFVLVLLGVTLHGGLRYMAARRLPAPVQPQLREVYMYTIYERQWHWLQTAGIFGLIFTGLVIHKPDMFAMFSFQGVVLVHNALAVILIINAALAAFYHLASGEIRQFLPEPRGFFGQMFAQAKYYLWGIFRGEPHPFEKTRNRKMNPIQQVTYLALLNVLLPLQVITGVLMWGAQHMPGLMESLGGLPFLAPFHSLIAWLLATFIVLHVYMTTTGHTPLANIQAMMLGWDEVEVHSAGNSQTTNEA